MAKVVRAWAPVFAIALPGAGIAALGLAALVSGGPWMDRSTALSLVALGLGLLAAWPRTRAARVVRIVLALAIAAMGIAHLEPHVVGRATQAAMGAAAAACLPLAGLVLATIDRPAGRAGAVVVQLSIGVLVALGIVSLIARDVAPEGLLPWYRAIHVPAATAAAFTAAGIALLGLVARSPWYERVYARHQDEKILVLVLGILSLVIVTMGAAAFVAMQRNLERAVQGALAQAVRDRATILESVFANRAMRAAIVGSRPAVAEALRQWNATRDPHARERLRNEAVSFLTAGFDGLAFRDASGAEVAQAGVLAEAPALVAPLAKQRQDAALLWNDRYVLRVRVPVRDRHEMLGEVLVEQPLEIVGKLQFDDPGLGRTAEWVLCAPAAAARMACFPRRFALRAETLERRRDNAPVPMDLALAGGAGVVVADDYRGDRVVAGYAPVGFTGLGVVLKLRVDELYAPLQNEIHDWWRWYLAVALLGALLVASQVRPVAQRLVQSERLERERADVLARSERALRDLYASLGDGIVVLRPDGTIEFVNPAAERLFGYEARELVGRPVASLIPEELRGSHALSTRRFMEAGTSNVVGRGNLVFPALRHDGSRFDLEFSLAPMRQGEELRLVAVLRDVSQRTALDRMKSEFTAAVSHELRTPLTSIMGSLELLREDTPADAPSRELLEMAWRNSHRLALLVNDVLDAERLESGALQFHPERFALAEFLDEAVRLDAPYVTVHDATLRLERPVPEATLHADRARLMQVMGNLVSNGAKFSPPGGEVRVRARVAGDRVRIEVSDRGRGIPDAFRDRVFEKFAQADASDARDKGGTGLGLAICKAIVERSGGTIGFTARRGGGTTFWVELPRAEG